MDTPSSVLPWPRDKIRMLNVSAKQDFQSRPLTDWYPVAWADEVRMGEGPTRAELFDTPLVLFRDEKGSVACFADRCPHRNVPLSLGQVRDGELICKYHGWRMNGAGVVTHIPCLRDDGRRREADWFACREQQGLVWVFSQVRQGPRGDPHEFMGVGAPGYTTELEDFVMEGGLHAVAENALDVPHTAVLHGGWFRKGSRGIEVKVNVRGEGQRVEAEYVGETRPQGLLGHLLAPGGGEVKHVDRFIGPCSFEVEYRMGSAHVISAGALCPLSARRTRMFGLISFCLPIPGKMISTVTRPFVRRILQQDAHVIEAQTRNVRRFGGEQHMSTPADVLGQEIQRILAGERLPEGTGRTLSLVL